jgi:FkbM family methyltransferase
MQFSDEGARLNSVATQDDIFNCFRLLLGRLPSRDEWVGHSGRTGERLEDVVATYINSLEFFNRGLMRPVGKPVSLVSLDGFVLYASPEDLAVGKHIIDNGSYEPNVSELFRQTVTKGMQVLDVGANIGFYTMLAASLVGPTGKVWSVEPNPENVRMILASRAQNGFNHAAVFQAAAGDHWETMCIFSDASNATVAPVSATEPSQYPPTVLSLPLDAVLADSRVDVMKIDVEGAEGSALRGMLRILRRDRPMIFCEFTPGALPGMSGMSGKQYLQFLLDLGYELAVLLDRPVECGQDIDRIMTCFEKSGLAHIDLLARPHASAANA